MVVRQSDNRRWVVPSDKQPQYILLLIILCAMSILFNLIGMTIIYLDEHKFSSLFPFEGITFASLYQSDHDDEPFVLTFLGDTMVGNVELDFATRDTMGNVSKRDAFAKVRNLLLPMSTGPQSASTKRRRHYTICNLEGPISHLGLDYDPYGRTNPAYSFGMDPEMGIILKEVGVDAVALANNHYYDRGSQGVLDTIQNLNDAGLRFFGLGESLRQASRPLIVDLMPSSTLDDGILSSSAVTVAVVGFSERYKAGKRAEEDEDQWIGFLLPTKEDAKLAIDNLNTNYNVTKKIAYVHWGKNYVASVEALRQKAKYLVDAGFDLIVGSDGSHLAQPVEFMNGVPVLYNVGNFVFHTPGRFNWDEKPDNSARSLPFGTVTHLVIDPRCGDFLRLEIHCIVVDNQIVNYVPEPCTPKEALTLFDFMGGTSHDLTANQIPLISVANGSNIGVVDLRRRYDFVQSKQGLDRVA